MVRDTSRAALIAMEQGNLLTKRRLQIYRALFRAGPCTANELLLEMPAEEVRNAANINTRLRELNLQGVVSEVGKKVCTVTGMNVIEWDVTSKMPKELPPKTSKFWYMVVDGNELVRAIDKNRAPVLYALKTYKTGRLVKLREVS